MKNGLKTKIPKKDEKLESVKINGFPNKDEKNTDKIPLAYKQWMEYKGKQ